MTARKPGAKIGQKNHSVVPAQPFADWCTARLEEYEKELRFGQPPRSAKLPRSYTTFGTGPARRLADLIGWEGEGGLRRLYRYSRCLMSGSTGKGKHDRHADFFPRATVEDALHRAGYGLWEVYPELVEDIILEPDRYCDGCHEIVTPFEGVCPWCERCIGSQPDRKLAA